MFVPWCLFELHVRRDVAGRTLVASVRGPEIIGCEGWGIYHTNGTAFSGW